MEIRPFRGIRYNEKIVRDLASVICPPYDVITPEMQKVYYQRSSYNVIRLEHPLTDRSQPAGYGYKVAAAIFREWLEKGVLKFDDSPSFYLHDCYFNYLGVERRQRGLIACLGLTPWGRDIRPHEETSPRDKSDRLQLMRACQANFSPLFCLYQDAKKEIASILSEAAQGNPIMSLQANQSNPPDSDERHVVWAISDPRLQQKLSALSRQVSPVIMADGHHRYETALVYQQERALLSHDSRLATDKFIAADKLPREEAFNYVMVTLVEFSDPGLFVFPIHRLVHGLRPQSSLNPSVLMEEPSEQTTPSPATRDSCDESEDVLSHLMRRLEDFFTLEFVPLSGNVPQSLISGLKGHLLGVLGLKLGHLTLLRERQDAPLKKVMPADRSQAYQKFDISILNHIILGKTLGLTISEENIAYTMDPVEACQRVENGDYQLAFLVNPPQPKTIKAIVDAGDRMPRKSTYFYPKIPTGLIINSLD